jgi:hypothetical protein
VVQKVEPALGSTTGGTLVTISGGGFPTLANRTAVSTGTASVLVGGQPCDVEQSSFSQIVCRTAALPSGSIPEEKSVAGFFVGGRGVDTYLFPFGGGFTYVNIAVCPQGAAMCIH